MKLISANYLLGAALCTLITSSSGASIKDAELGTVTYEYTTGYYYTTPYYYTTGYTREWSETEPTRASTEYPYYTSTEAPTGTCCTFEEGACDLISFGWYLSVTSPNEEIPKSSGNYLWSDITGAQVQSAEFTNVNYYTTFNFSYYVTSSDAELLVSFVPNGGLVQYITTLTYESYAQWRNTTITCGTTCCGEEYSSCDGQLVIEIQNVDSAAVAIDEFARDGGCAVAPYCCYFNDPSVCGYYPFGTYWVYSSSSVYDIPYPGSPFIYLRVTNDNENSFVASLSSSPITIENTAVFDANIYVNIDESEQGDMLDVYFYNSATSVYTQLDYVRDSNGGWKVFNFQCDNPHGNCCQDSPSCTGNIVFEAKADPYSSTVTYAVDAVGIVGECTPPLQNKLPFYKRLNINKNSIN